MKRLALFVVILAVSFAQAESKGKVCIWVDSEVPGAIVGAQTGGSVSSVTAKEVAAIQTSATEALKTDKSNVVVSPCPQSGENIELDVVVGKFRGGYVASVSIVIAGGKDGPLHVSSNVIAASTQRILASDVAIAYESTKLRVQTSTVK